MGNDMIVSLCKIYELNSFCAFFFADSSSSLLKI